MSLPNDDAARLLSHRCKIHAAQLASLPTDSMLSGIGTAHSNMGQHHWIDRALRDHPWRVSDPQLADVQYVNASFALVAARDSRRDAAALNSMLFELHDCSAFARKTNRSAAAHCASLGQRPERPTAAPPGDTTTCRRRPLRFAYGDCHQSECAARQGHAPLIMPRTAVDGSLTIWIKDFKQIKHEVKAQMAGKPVYTSEMVAPFVVWEPRWLVDGVAPATYRVPWADRKLLFFAGHMPQVYSRAVPTQPARSASIPVD